MIADPSFKNGVEICYEWIEKTKSSITLFIFHKPSIIPHKTEEVYIIGSIFWPLLTNRWLAVDTCQLSVSRKCIYLGNEGETFNFLKPISCQHWWLNISWAHVWSDSGELPVRRFSRHFDWWGDISWAAVPQAVTRSYSPLYTVGQLSVVPPRYGCHRHKDPKTRSSAETVHYGLEPTQHTASFKYICAYIRTMMTFFFLAISSLFAQTRMMSVWRSNRLLFEVLLKYELKVTVRVLKSSLKLLTALKYVQLICFSRRGFPQLQFDLFRECK